MAIQIMQEVWLEATTLGGTELVLLLALADAADPESRQCWPSVGRLATQTRRSERQVQAMLRRLEVAGFIGSQPRAGSSTMFTIQPVDYWPEAPVDPPQGGEEDFTPEESCRGEASFTGGGEADCTPGVKPAAPRTVREPSEGTVTSRAAGDYSMLFLHFWAAYPRKVGKGAAWKAWRQQRCGALEVDFVAVIEAAKKSVDWQRENGRFIPHPATWLNRRGWEDEATAVPATSSGFLEKLRGGGVR